MHRPPQYKTAIHLTEVEQRSRLENQDIDYAPSLVVKWEEKTVASTKEPKVFGPPLWFVIHNSAAHYPPSPSPICQQHVIKFIKSIPYLVPCDECFIHAQNYICNFNDDQLRYVTSTRSRYFEWTVNFHNFVNERLGKRQISVKEAYNMYHNSPKVKVMTYSN